MNTEKTSDAVAFWNCGLAPASRDEDKIEDSAYQLAGQTVEEIVRGGVSLLGLCEVGEQSIGRLRHHLPRSFQVRSRVKKIPRTRWDLAIAWNPSVWEVRRGRDLLVRDQDYSYRAGYKTTVTHQASDVRVAIYLLHWRSRLHDGERARRRCAQHLRSEIKKDRGRGFSILVMGDFNDEPFDSALEDLNASRDIGLVRARPELLFNPFWRYLGHEDHTDTVCGTYYHRNGEMTRWRTYDQIIVSADFLDGSRLQYDGASLIKPSSEHQTLSRSEGHADHIPVKVDLIVEQPGVNQ